LVQAIFGKIVTFFLKALSWSWQKKKWLFLQRCWTNHTLKPFQRTIDKFRPQFEAPNI